MARAAMLSSLRRGRRVKESATSRRNIFRNVRRKTLLSRYFLRGFCHGGNVDHHVVPLDLRGKADGIASTLLPDGRNINGRSAVTADHVLTILPVALRAAHQ